MTLKNASPFLHKGLVYKKECSWVSVFAPYATQVEWLLYENDHATLPFQKIPLEKGKDGFFQSQCKGDLEDKYYAFSFFQNGEWSPPLLDFYTKSTGCNGKRAQILAPSANDVTGWESDHFENPLPISDAIIYELHVRDFSISPNSGIRHKGKYKGLVEPKTLTADGLASGLDHLKELGITHVQLMPVFDFDSVDESYEAAENYNWGYDPYHWMVPEGSYSDHPSQAKDRIIGFKQMILAFHQAGIGVIMDLVLNHFSENRFQELVYLYPNELFRTWPDGSFSNGSGCGNEVASEKKVARQLLIQTVLYWVKNFHIDGFRFDLMGLMDLETLEKIKLAVDAVHPNIYLYGEGWTGGATPMDQQHLALKTNIHKIKGVGVFNDDFRDAVKGHVFASQEGGFINGENNCRPSVQFGITGAVYHPQIDYPKVNYSDGSWAVEPTQCINYISCHDNLTLWDKINLVQPDLPEEEKIKIHKMGLTILLLSQGIPFLHSGVEMLRTKFQRENSYKDGDAINQIDWHRKLKYKDVFTYLQKLIALRKAHPAFQCQTGNQIRTHLYFLNDLPPHILAFELSPHANGDEWRRILLVVNSSPETFNMVLPNEEWYMVLESYIWYEGKPFRQPQLTLEGRDCVMLYAR
jgi:pullulanase